MEPYIIELVSSTGPLGLGLWMVWHRLGNLGQRMEELEARVVSLEARRGA